MRATVVKWFDSRGFGFAKPEAVGSVDLFVHATDFPDAVRRSVCEGMVIHCDLATTGDTRRPRATNVVVLSGE